MARKEHYGWEVFLGTFLGAVATVALLGALISLIWASAIGIGVQTPAIIGAVVGGILGASLGHVPASQRTAARRRHTALIMAGLIGLPLMLLAVLGAAVGLLRYMA